MTGYQIMKFRENAFRLGLCLAFEHLRHHGSRRLRNSAAAALKTNVTDRAILHVNIDGEMIAAERIESLSLVVGRLNRTEILGLLAVLQNHFLVKIPQLANVRHYPSTSCTLWIPFTSASTSSRVL